MLTVKEYQAREEEAVAGLPNRVVEMVNPVVFASEGYPARVRSESELWKYLDVMHETRFERDFATLFGGGMTEPEFSLLRRAAQLANDFSIQTFGRNLTSRGSLLRALRVYGHIADIFGGSPARVFEIGPGSGYLGCLFIQNGWSYAASDIAQAFYLLQNRLWNCATGGKVKDLVEDPEWDGTLSPGCPVHLPWWEFYKLLDRQGPSVDVVTCNHALAEMHPNSLAFALRAARGMLRGEGIKAFVFEGWGFEKFIPRSTITEQFYKSGFRLVHNDDELTVFSPLGADGASPSAKLPRFGSFLKSGPGQPSGKVQGRRRWRLAQTLFDLKQSVGSLAFLSGLKQFAFSLMYWPPRVSSPKNRLSQCIVQGRNRRGAGRSVGMQEVNEFYATLLKSQDLRTPDERFLEMIGKAY
jgi:SAM-dependent methyltransferase